MQLALWCYYCYSFWQPHYTRLMRLGDILLGGVLFPSFIICVAIHFLTHGSLGMREHAVFLAYLFFPVAASLLVHYEAVPLLSNLIFL
ncbi:MAG: hypothetical protein AB1656_12440 [Candidatus Omnitrophota bacterium]